MSNISHIKSFQLTHYQQGEQRIRKSIQLAKMYWLSPYNEESLGNLSKPPKSNVQIQTYPDGTKIYIEL